MKNNKGITMIELITSMAILGIIGLMVAGILSTSVRMYQTTITYADIQTESQTVSRRISDVIMNAENLYIDESSDGTFLFTGTVTAEATKTIYTGEVVWFNKTSRSLYYNGSASMEVSASAESVTDRENRPLTAEVVKAALENVLDKREYLISQNIKSLNYTISPELKEEDRIKAGSDFYAIKEKVTIGYELVLSDFADDDYTVNSSTTPRNMVGYLYVKGDSSVE